MHRVVIAALIAASLAAGATGLPETSADTRHAQSAAGDDQEARGRWRWEECRFRRYVGGPSFSRGEIELIVRCGNRHWPVPGGWRKAFDVIACESGWGQFAVSPGGHLGLFQFAPSTFASVRARWADLWRRWHVPRSPFNARANVLAGMRKASADGWGAWSCA